MKYRVTATVDVKFDVESEASLVEVVNKLCALPEVRSVRRVQRVVTEEIRDEIQSTASCLRNRNQRGGDRLR